MLVVCSGTFEQPALEDVLAAGALCGCLDRRDFKPDYSDSVGMAVSLFAEASSRLGSIMAQSRNARRLLSQPELRDDVAYCALRDIYGFLAQMRKDALVKEPW